MATKRLVKNKKKKGDDLYYPPKSFNITVKQQEFLDTKRRRYETFQEAQYLRKLIGLGIKVLKDGEEKYANKLEKPTPVSAPTLPFPQTSIDVSTIIEALSSQMQIQVQRLIDTQTIALDKMAKGGRPESNGNDPLVTKLGEQLASLTRQVTELTAQNEMLTNLLVQTLGASNLSSELLLALLGAGKTNTLIEPAQKRAVEETQKMYAQAQSHKER
jgi:hypothetical protein